MAHMTLKDAFVRHTPRETGGVIASNRLDYQKDWALCLLLELHQNEGDYVLLLDYIDDIVVADSAAEPSTLDFYQVKTKAAGNFTFHKLTASSNGELSILGKLAKDYSAFPAHTKSLNLVSNAHFSFCSDKKQGCFNEVAADQVDTALEAIRLQLGLMEPPKIGDLTFFICSDLHVEDHATHSRGKLSDFLEAVLPGQVLCVPSFYRALFDEIKRRNNRQVTETDFDKVSEYKGISRQWFEKQIQGLKNFKDIESEIRASIEGLKDDFTLKEREEIRGLMRSYRAEISNSTNLEIQRLRRTIIDALSLVRSKPYSTLAQKIELVLAEANETVNQALFGKDYEPPRVSWRLLLLRGWSYEYTKKVPTGST